MSQTFMYDVFLSHTEADKPRVRRVAEALRDAGLSVWFDGWMVKPGHLIPELVDKGLEQSRKVVLFMSPDFFRSDWATRERSAVVGGDPANKERRAIPVLLSACDIPPSLAHIRQIDYSDADSQEALAELLAACRNEVETSLPQPAIIWPPADVGYQWPLADRKHEFSVFQRMASGASPRRILVVKGASNTGKTELLSKLLVYAQRMRMRRSLLDMKGCPPLDQVFDTLLLDLGAEVLPRANRRIGMSRATDVIHDLKDCSVPVVLAFDTYQEASSDAHKWLETFVPRLEEAPAVLIIIGGQEVPDCSRHPWRDLSEFRELRENPSAGDWFEYLQQMDPAPQLTCEQVGLLTSATDGNPGQMSAMLKNLGGKSHLRATS